MDFDDCIFFIGLSLIACLITGLFVSGCTAIKIERDAVQAGVAEYYINHEHDKAFRWKTNAVGEGVRR